VRARWKVEETGRGTYLIVVTEIPWQVQKMRLVERIAELLNDKKLPLLADMRDESAEDVRLVLEPRSRAVDPALMMESLFKLTELESRVPLNMNVLVAAAFPRSSVSPKRSANGSRTGATCCCAARATGSVADRASARSLGRLSRRLSQPRQGHQNHPQGGRAEAGADEDVQAHRRSGRRHSQHAAAQSAPARRDGNPRKRTRICAREKVDRGAAALGEAQWKTIAEEIREVRDTFGPKTPLGKRRTGFAEAPEHDEAAIEEALVEREPVTIVVSEKGWIRALRGQVADLSSLAFKADDG
jgi:topoisomerase-4 subunit A